jgi:hypothetical protein
MSSIILSCLGVFQETGYQIQIEYYNKSEVFRTRPTVDDGALTEFPGFN